MKRLFDLLASGGALLIFGPVILLFAALVFAQDRHNPFYTPVRAGRNGFGFRMIKLRSMVANADKLGGSSTSGDDRRITIVGKLIRKFKLDELTQLWNVFRGEMSLVGPRPNTIEAVENYTSVEKQLLTVRPGITDFASIVYSDEGEILRGQTDPDVSYNQLIRPGKSLLSLFYTQRSSLLLDLKLCWLTAIAILSRDQALAGLQRVLKGLAADPELLRIASRRDPLLPSPPPGGNKIVTSRDGNPYV